MVLIFSLLYLLTAFQTAIFDFNRTISTGDTTEAVSGSIYYAPRGRSIVEVKHPILQYMIFSEKHWTVYYPEKGKAYTFSGEQAFQLPLIDVLFASFKEDFGLVDAGFRLQGHETRSDTILSFWSSGGISEDYKIKLVQIKEKYVTFELLQKDTTCIKTTFVKHHQFEDKFFPIEIFSEIFPGWMGNSGSVIESIKILNLEFDQPFPERILKFEIPPEVEVRKVQN